MSRCTVRRELKSLVRDALTAAAKKFPDKNLSAEVDDYRLELFNIGWEGIGHWESECECPRCRFWGIRFVLVFLRPVSGYPKCL